MTVLGIDLGTTFSSIAIWKNDREHIFSNRRNQENIESMIFVKKSKQDCILGVTASEKGDRYPERVIFDSKRMLGRRFHDPRIQELITRLPFKVVGDANDRIFIDIPESRVGHEVYPAMQLQPWEVSAEVLRQLLEVAKSYKDGEDVKDCVITVPANFTDGQKSDTLKAARAAGLPPARVAIPG